MTTKWTKHEQEEAVKKLREMIQPGDTIWTVLRHISSSGMYRAIDLYKIMDNDRLWLSRLAAKAMDTRFDERREAIGVPGCGMDMGFHLVYSLSRNLFPDGFDCVGEKCPSNDHYNYRGRIDDLPEHTCQDHIERKTGVCRDQDCVPWHHRDGGYALRHRWL